MKHCLKLSELHIDEVMHLLSEAKKCEQGWYEQSETGKLVANLFFEPSTRTQYSFQVAQARLGCQSLQFQPEGSSLQKGESFFDTIKTFESFGVHALVIRSGTDEYYKELVDHLAIPILNAGDGTKDHPSQSLLDLYTIYEEFGRFAGLRIAVIGDIKHSRVAHSNLAIMKRLGMEVAVSGPAAFQEEGYDYLPFEEAIAKMDVIMLLRVQQERHAHCVPTDLADYHKQYGLTMERVASMKDQAIIMHPAPFLRGMELADDVVSCPKSRIFAQMHNGVAVRMALLKRAFGHGGSI